MSPSPRRLACLLLVPAAVGCIEQPDTTAAGPPPEGVVMLDGGWPLPPVDAGGPAVDRGRPLVDRGGSPVDRGAVDRGGPADRGVDPPDRGAPPACVGEGPAVVASIDLPLGETLFFDGDDHLAFWGVDARCPVVVVGAPADSTARIVEGPDRFTPDRVGRWVLARGEDRVTVNVRDDLLDEDTFLNYNYSPTHPLAVVDGDRLWVASPQSNAVQELVAGPGDPRAGSLVPVGGWPTALAWWPEARLLVVVQTARDSLGFVDVDTRRLVDAIPVGDEPAAVALDLLDARGPTAWVALSGADAVARVDLRTRRVVQRIAVGRDPRALALDPTGRPRLYVASMLSSNAHPRGRAQDGPPPASTRRDVAVVDTARDTVAFVPEVGTILRGVWPDPDPGRQRVLVSLTHARNQIATVQATSRPHAHGLAEIWLDGSDPGEWRVRQHDLDRQRPAPSPFSVQGTPDGRLLLVTLSAGGEVLLLDAGDLREVGRLSAGSTPRGIAFAGGRTWTYAWLDDAVVGWPTGRLEQRPPPVRVPVGADPTPDRIKAGQRIYYDATFSALGDFSCNSCHPDGLVDGLVWNLLLDGDVNTLPFRNVGGTDPFLWGGQLPTLFDFSREVLRLVGASATGEQMELLTEYVQSVVAPPNPHTLPGGRFTPAAERGRAVFAQAGCAGCHSGPLLTNRQRLPGKTAGLTTDVPSLIGVYDTGPWGRQGQWHTLEAMVDFALEFTGAELGAGQRDDLVAYVRQLPGDLLYLTAARPLSGSRSVYHRIPVELAFNSNLAAGQAERFAFERRAGGGWTPVPGRWRVSGRYARFEGEALPFESQFRIRVEEGLRGTLGLRLGGPVEVAFETGRLPDFDTTGRWVWEIRGAVGGDIDIALLQATGGHVSGALIDGDGLIDLDHLEGFVSGSTLFIDPFPVLSPFGEVMVESAEIELEDLDGDGTADRGEGRIFTPFVDLDVFARRVGP